MSDIGGLRRASPGRHRLEVDRFESLAGVELIDVPLPAEPSVAGVTRSVQHATDPRLLSGSVSLAHRPRVAIVPDGRLASGGGAVFGRDGELVLETLWDEEHRRRDFDPPPRLSPPHRLQGRHASIVSLWCENFFHWLFDALPRLAVLQASGVTYESLIVPDPLTPFQRETLELLEIPHERLTPFLAQHVQADELVWAAPLAPIGRPTPLTIDWLRRSFGQLASSGPPGRRVYLRRTGSRRVVNERSLLRELTPLSFEALDPGSLTFREQVRLFSSLEVAVGPHGAAFANGVFSEAMQALELYQPAHVNSSIVNVMTAAGHPHWNLLCRRVPSLRRAKHQNMWAPVDLVRRTLDRMGISR